MACLSKGQDRPAWSLDHTRALLLLASVCLPPGAISAVDYQMPPKAIADIADAPPTPSVRIDPTRRRLLILERPSLPSIEELARPEFRLAGIRIDPKTRGPSRASYYTELVLLDISTGERSSMSGLPANARVRSVQWSPDGKRVAFIVTRDNGNHLWLADVATSSARRLTPHRISAVYGSPFVWLPDSETIVCKTVPEGPAGAPEPPTVPSGPVVQQTADKQAPARTYQDLLKNEHDEALFEHYFAVQVQKVSLDGRSSPIGSPGIICRVSPSPNGRCLLVETVHRPFSYLVPAHRFPFRVGVWDLEGNVVKQIADLPLAEEVPIRRDAVRTGPRSFGWRADAPATLYWVEAQDGGDPKAEADVRDAVFTLPSPFTDAARELISLKLRYSAVRWGHEHLALVTESWWDTRSTRVWRADPAAAPHEPALLLDYSWQDRYGHPGEPLTAPAPTGHYVLATANSSESVYLSGDGGSPEGDRPFIDEFDVATRITRRLWRSRAPHYERAITFVDADHRTLLTRRESPDEPPNYFLRSLDGDEPSQLTHFPHPAPALTGVQKELIRYEREDGIKLTAKLYLPRAYAAADGPLPLLMWMYPREFRSPDAAGQVDDSPYRFVTPGWSSPLVWLALGYAVLDGPTMPIVGGGDEEPNDTYVEQLVSSARAAVDEVVRRGVAERGRIAIGGHSYGAFATANLLAHSDLFAAGVARSGAYNRTLTPFGFQSEERTVWEARDVYANMSPFLHADGVNEPLLLIHGEADNNSGTFPLQSERLFNAIKGLGGTARLVLLPCESHGYRARESIMHVLWETRNWLEEHVANAEPRGE
ncbi:MAG: prolyl oligopeptidase family serine peptidase [Armatimonadota bacterium]